MLETTPQERLALMVLALLLGTGAIVRNVAFRLDSPGPLESTAGEAGDAETPDEGSLAELRARAERERDLERIREMPLAPGEKLDPNSAPAEQLARLPRIGPGIAQRIVAHREAHGPFRALSDLAGVPGIGPVLFDAIAPHINLPRAPPGTRRAPTGSQIDINRASREQLESLPGIGPVIADRIVRYREGNGPFRSFQDLENVSGVGSRLRERLESVARIGP